jgi:hypothetical protein
VTSNGGRPSLSEGKTPRRTFRIPDSLYNDATAIAKLRGEGLSDVVRRCLEQYIHDTVQEVADTSIG